MNDQLNILVVDDVEMNRDALSRRLERKGYAVLLAEDGYKALGMVEQNNVDLILLDIMMPGITGLDVLKVLRQNHSPADLPIIMATAKDQDNDMVAALNLGANDYVTKPINFPVLLARVESQLRMKKATTAPVTHSIAGDLAKTQVKRGVTLAERYRLEQKIGEGAFGTVYRGTDLRLQRPIAVKLLKAGVAETPEALAQFRHEGITTCRVSHPNAVAIFDFGITPARGAYLVMELLEGNSLEAELAKKGKLSPQRCAEILKPIADVMKLAHKQNIIHRDLKPANIFLHQSQQGEMVKVVDFGIAKLIGNDVAETLTQEYLVGTPYYTAPEGILSRAYDPRSDVYSLGVMLYKMLSGKLPFEIDHNDVDAALLMHIEAAPIKLREVVPDIPADIEGIVMQALHKDPAKRPTVSLLSSHFINTVNP